MIQNATYFKCSGKWLTSKKHLLEFTVMIKALYKRLIILVTLILKIKENILT